MAEFEVINVEPRTSSFIVEIELPDRTRRKFGYPMGEGWEQIQGDTHKFIADISYRLDQEQVNIQNNFKNIKSLSKSIKNQKFIITPNQIKKKENEKQV